MKGKRQETLGGKDLLPLGRFEPVDVPDEKMVRLVYSDFRTMTASSNQCEYVYRLNSLFDPDQSGVGGQPDGFDQWKTLYATYRVVAVEYEVEAVVATDILGMIACAPTNAASTIASAEEVAGLRHAKSAIFAAGGGKAKMRNRLHISQAAGATEQAVLGDDTFGAGVTANPGTVVYLFIAAETSGATSTVYFRVKITYYARLQFPIVTIDSVAKHRRRFEIATAALAAGSAPPAAPSTLTPTTQGPRIIPSSVSEELTVGPRGAPPAQQAVSIAIAPSGALGSCGESGEIPRELTPVTHVLSAERTSFTERVVDWGQPTPSRQLQAELNEAAARQPGLLRADPGSPSPCCARCAPPCCPQQDPR